VLVFDEVYFAKFGQAYLDGAAPFDAHPPLGKYFIALGIWLSTHVPLFAPFFKGSATVAVTPEVSLFPFSYRWMNALVGGCIPLLVMGLAFTLGRWQASTVNMRSIESQPVKTRQGETRQGEAKNLAFAVLAGAFVAIDGLFITESRYALINVYMVFFGLLGHWLWLRAIARSMSGSGRGSGWGFGRDLVNVLYLVLAGFALGGAIATKWNGLGYVLSLLLWELWRWCSLPKESRGKPSKNTLFACLMGLILLPAIAYWLAWLPHLSFAKEGMGSVHALLLSFHQNLSAGGHPACSQWLSWPLLIKPIAYWYEMSDGLAYTVNNLGNPLLWWLSGAAMILLLLEQVLRLRRSAPRTDLSGDHLRAYLLISYTANWLPWVLVHRCTFIYLYMPAAVFGFMVLAWLLSEWLYAPYKIFAVPVKIMGWMILAAIALAFIFWLPLSLGSPLMPEALQTRWWLRSWI
jgi:dolichyl-phosphate-mannose-protein mannosyltransferase